MAKTNTNRKTVLNRQGYTLAIHGHLCALHYGLPFSPLRHREINILETDIGGFKGPKAGNKSLRMWKEYLPEAQITSRDIYDKIALQEDRIQIYQGSQDDAELLKRMYEECGEFDIINNEDESHHCAHFTASSEILFSLLMTGVVYALEDLQTSYLKVTGGSST